ncbi:hypothetical protein FB381_4008 [Nocardioides albertanoniae]|uniref:Uncharacterized protein n=1 Tax=Nocardioides albertanoniae TaxID=1175486 RepID=A0A543ABW0_9ACTN|nr:hypothetical protein [Nocardioides albertanoniae]TQL70082.1 hypothetical protein FB381_4008 [Nocardioides albertanoniae]
MSGDDLIAQGFTPFRMAVAVIVILYIAINYDRIAEFIRRRKGK